MAYISSIDVWKALLLTFLVLLVMSGLVYYNLILNLNSFSLISTEKHLGFILNQTNDSVVAFITAHPDDECMFFGPTVLQTVRLNPKNVHLLCLTTGNFYNRGHERQKELHQSCKVLGIPASNIRILDNSSFLDGSREWVFQNLLPELLEYQRQVKPDYIFTFDDYGVSGHTNHIATSVAVRQMYKNLQSRDKTPRIFELESVPIYRKFLSVLDTLLSVLSGHPYFVSSPSDIFKAQRAMCTHKSQLVWFRWLYIIFSRYMLINTYNEVTLESSSNSS